MHNHFVFDNEYLFCVNHSNNILNRFRIMIKNRGYMQPRKLVLAESGLTKQGQSKRPLIVSF